MSQVDILVSKVNETWLHIDCDRSIAHEMSEYFSFFVPNYRFMPKYKERIWDGKIRLLNSNMTLYTGLISHLQKFAEINEYSIEIDKQVLTKIDSPPALKEYIESLVICDDQGKRITPYPEQITAFSEALYTGRRVIESPTATGKSLIIYALCHYLLTRKIIDDDKKILIIVPTISLVKQMTTDFMDYALEDSDFDPADEIHQIMGGTEKNGPGRIYISTWQSIFKLSKKYFHQFSAIIGDECHEYEAGSVQKIMEQSTNAFVRIGLTGTLRDGKMNRLQVEGIFGPAIKVTTIDKAIKAGRTSPIEIKFQHLFYNRDAHLLVKGMKYPDEIDWLITHSRRNKFIASIALTRPDKENTLILTSRINQIELLEELIAKIQKKKNTNKEVHVVHGSTGVDDREIIRKLIDKKTGVIIIASYGVFQRGINMKNLHNIIFGSPSKSMIRVLQSIGRGLRKAKGKTHLVLWDLIDDVVQLKSKKNFSFNHAMERYKIYSKENLPSNVRKIELYPADEVQLPSS